MALIQPPTHMDDLEALLNYKPQNQLLFWEALHAAGAPSRIPGLIMTREGNKRLALLGDAILRSVIIEDWFDTLQPTEEAQNEVTRVVANRNLDEVAREHGLDGLVVRNPSQPQVNQKTMTATLEALIGAVYLDGGLDATRAVMRTLALVQ